MPNVLQKWAVYEANVQQYRVLSATVQSFLLAIGAILFSINKVPTDLVCLAVALIGMVHIFYVWMPVVLVRNLIVDYYKGQLDLSHEQQIEIAGDCKERDFVKCPDKRKLLVEKYFAPEFRITMRETRKKLDQFVPRTYAFIWGMMIVCKFYMNFF